MVVILLWMLSTAVSAACFLNLLTSTDISQAHHREHYSCWICICEVSQHTPRRASGIPRRRYPTNVHTQACAIRLTNFTCWWGGGEFIFLSLPIFRLQLMFELLCLSRLPAFRFIAVMLFGDPSGLSSYQACCGAASQVRTRSGSGSRAFWRCFEVTGVIGLYCASQSGSSSGDMDAQVLSSWVTAFFAFTIATNLLSSGKCFYACAGCWDPECV
jgi:hypothetical protein